MPIPVHSTKAYSCTIQTILKARISVDVGWCLSQHQRHCYVEQENIVINILEKQSDILLERWIMSIDTRDTCQDENIAGFLSTMPANGMNLYAIVVNDENEQCYSHVSRQEAIEFKPDSHLTAKQFQLSNLCLKVVYELYPKGSLPWSSTDQVHPFALLPPIVATSPPRMFNNTNTPMIAVRRLSRLSLSAIDNESSTNNYNAPIPIPSPHMQYTHHHNSHGMIRSNVAYSTSPKNNLLSPYVDEHRRLSVDHQHGFVGSFEESLFSGRMSTMPSKPITFHCQIGVLGIDCKPILKCPPHWSIVFPATFYKLPENEDTTTPPDSPYVGTIDLYEYASNLPKSPAGYRIPAKGQLQVVIKNPNKTAVKLFLIPYDFQDMPKNTKTFLRQKSYATEEKHVLRYAIHLQFYRNEKNRIYLYKSIRVVFANRKADAREKLNVVCEGPKEPVYITCK